MYKISYKTELHVGKGALQQLSHYKNEHILVVADPFLKTSGTLDAILANFDDSNDIVVFTDIVPDPPIETVVAGIKCFLLVAALPLMLPRLCIILPRSRVPSQRLFSSPFLQQAELDLK